LASWQGYPLISASVPKLHQKTVLMNQNIEKTDKSTLVELFDTHQPAEGAVKELQKAGFDMSKLSIIAKNYESDQHVLGFYNMGDRVKTWGKFGGVWGGFMGLLFGMGVFFIPGVGPVVVAGHFLSVLIATLEGAVVFGGLSAVGAALSSLGIPKNSILKYETELKAGKYLLVVHGTADEVNRAKDILRSSGAKIKDLFAA
jgi:hypothetical protein